METIYRVIKSTYNDNPKVEEIQIESKTEKFFTKVGSKRKDAFDTQYDKHFFDRQEAIEFMRQQRINEIESAKETLDTCEASLAKFNMNYPPII